MKRKKRKGFTLVELIVVLLIIGIISVIAVPNINSFRKNLKEKSREKEVSLIKLAAENYALDNKSKILEECENGSSNCQPCGNKANCYEYNINTQTLVDSDYIKEQPYLSQVQVTISGKGYSTIKSNIIDINTPAIRATTYIKNLVKGKIPEVQTDEINLGSGFGDSCTYTLAYDGTEENNLFYTGKNPCNNVVFNNESPTYRYETGFYFKDNPSELAYSSSNPQECSTTLSLYKKQNGDIYTECRDVPFQNGSWRIMGVMNKVDDGTGKKETRVKLIRNYSIGRMAWDNKNGSCVNNWPDATLKAYLNETYLNGLSSSAVQMTGDAVYHLGGIGSYAQAKSTPYQAFTNERSNITWGQSVNYPCNDGYCPRATVWTGKIGLMYFSDYGFGIGGPNRTKYLNWEYEDYREDVIENKWLANENFPWTITPYSVVGWGVNYIQKNGSDYDIQRSCTYPNFEIYPVLYLKADVKITGGTGTFNSPYILSQ